MIEPGLRSAYQQQVEFIQHHLLFVRAHAVLKHDIDVAGGHHGAVAAFGVINVRAYFHFIAFAHFVELLLVGAVAFVERHNLKTAEVLQQLRFNVIGLLQVAGSGRFQSYPLFAFPEGDVAFSTFDDQLAHSGVRLYVCAYRSLRKRKLGIFWEWQRMGGDFYVYLRDELSVTLPGKSSHFTRRSDGKKQTIRQQAGC